MPRDLSGTCGGQAPVLLQMAVTGVTAQQERTPHLGRFWKRQRWGGPVHWHSPVPLPHDGRCSCSTCGSHTYCYTECTYIYVHVRSKKYLEKSVKINTNGIILYSMKFTIIKKFIQTLQNQPVIRICQLSRNCGDSAWWYTKTDAAGGGWLRR